MARPVAGAIPGARSSLAVFRYDNSQAVLLEMIPDDINGILSGWAAPGEDVWDSAQINSALAAGDWGVLAIIPGHYLGFCIGKPGQTILEILQVAVRPEHRRKGLARRMLESMCGVGKGGGMEEIWLEVRASNLPARSLYENCGFIQTGVRSGYYGGGRKSEDAVLMSRAL